MNSSTAVKVEPEIVQTRFLQKLLGPAESIAAYSSCPLCSSHDFVPLVKVGVRGGESVLERSLCLDCYHVAFSLMPSQDWFFRHYREEFETATPPPSSPPIVNFGFVSDLLMPYLNPDAKILDVGCGYGSGLQHFKKMGFQNLFGLELSDRRVEVARRSGLRVAHCGAEEMLDDPVITAGAPFDAVFSWHTFEHVYDPRRSLVNVVEVLRPGGVLFIGVPNLDAEHLIQMAHYTPHIHSYSLRSLATLLGSLGLDVVYADESLRIMAVKRTNGVGGGVPQAELEGRFRGDVKTRVKNKFIRDFGLRQTPVLSRTRAVVQFSDYRGNREVLEPSFGIVCPIGERGRRLRLLLEANSKASADRWPKRVHSALDRRLASHGPLLFGDIAIAERAQPLPVADIVYQQDEARVWIK